AVARLVQRAHVVGEAEAVLLGLAGKVEAADDAVPIVGVVDQHRVAVRQGRPVAVDGGELEIGIAALLLDAELQTRLKLLAERLLPAPGFAELLALEAP